VFTKAVRRAIGEVHEFSGRPGATFDVRRGDCRQELQRVDGFDLSVFSPPYPNSFDYTDVYNVELWALGYLTGRETNTALRRSTLTSHVQIKRDFANPPAGSQTLDRTLARLHRTRGHLWSKWIPSMVGAYFSDLSHVLRQIKRGLARRGKAWIVVGDSRYAGVHVPVAEILCELAVEAKWKVETAEPFRSMRSSPQQGGQHQLAESLLVLCHA
jgi:hypothetical protein